MWPSEHLPHPHTLAGRGCRRLAPVRSAGAPWATLPVLGSGGSVCRGQGGAAAPGCGETTTSIEHKLFTQSRTVDQPRVQSRGENHPMARSRLDARSVQSLFVCRREAGAAEAATQKGQVVAGLVVSAVPANRWAWSLVCQWLPLETSSVPHEELEQGPTSTPLPPGNARTARTTSPAWGGYEPSAWNRPGTWKPSQTMHLPYYPIK